MSWPSFGFAKKREAALFRVKLVEMGIRRSSGRAAAERQWAEFVAANSTRFQAAGLPALASESIAHWDDLLRHGRFALHQDRAGFQISTLRAEQYSILVDLTESYFAAGYEYYTPMGLKVEDQERLHSRFG